ncbi:Small-conductance mechanosensitive channel [Rhodovulum sp. ES.010]|uniref:mechanosensitive ion channel family protein n=1 Tax=Rhodovulum sp. ES.010 TaxID=1882821 RepID=UPI00092B7D14|nr:mechanosensitive ion channel family protein [Rhodovulum sp. ES.010]SIO44231.1 Small-conductance mechanosensitive channel [Rhodovulum sp. ES.010]
MNAADRMRAAASMLCLLMLVLTPLAARAQPADFSGDWQTFWRTGSAVLSLSQEGDRVTGTYAPDDGTVEGTVEGRVLRGTWAQPGASGAFVFALSEDGQVLTGRFGNGEYWNGFREDAEGGSGQWRLGNASPRETLRSLLIAANVATYAGDAGALRQVGNLVSYAGPPTNAGDRATRRTMMFDILDMSTLRIMDVPEAPEAPEEERVRFAVGPAAVAETTDLGFRRDAFGRWRLVLPDQAALAAVRGRFLDAMGHGSMSELDRARANSPRTVMREFIQGANSWDEGGRARALAVMDLSHIPERLHELEGPIYADFLKRILDRIAYVIWQEIPDDPDRSVPFVYFQHPVGDITIARVPAPAPEDGSAPPPERWKIASATLAAAPALLEAMQELPAIPGLEEPQALSPYFRLRETVRAAAPGLVVDRGYLELWQWLGLAAAFAAAVAAVAGIGAALRGLSRLGNGTAGLARLALPAGLLGAAVILSWAVLRLGLTQMGLPLVSTLAGLFVVVSLALLVYRLAGLVGGWFLARAEQTTSYVDEIAASLGTGLAKLLIVFGAIIAAADVVGLPYEGVLTGLGVGGVALAFAARDTVSNLLGGGILMADRPFQRGDLIELDGTLASVEQVGLRSTRLRSLDDTVLNVPNAQLSDRTIANWGKRRRRKVVLGIGLTYDTPRDKLDKFVKRLREVLLDQPRIDREDLYVGLKCFGASSIDIEVMCYLRVFAYGSQVEAQHALILDIVSLAEEVGVEFAFPTRTVQLAGAAEAPRALIAEPRSEEAANA